MTTPQDSTKRQLPVRNTRQVKKPSGKRAGGNSAGSTEPLVRSQSMANPSKPVNKAPLKPKSRLQGCLTTLGVIALFIASSAVIVGGIRLGILLMVNPNAVAWLNNFLPEWTRIPVSATSPPKTLDAIEAEIRQTGLIPGEALALSKSGLNEGSTPLLLPILKSSPVCQSDCEEIVELRVYQPTKPKYYQLVTQLPISGPEEYFVLSSLANTKSDQANSSRSLPLTKLTRDENAPEPGFWFNLSGQQLSGDTPNTYGQVIHYNPDQMHLSVMLQWTAPNENRPDWQQITGDAKPELVINQTVGLEPHFKVYRLQPRNFVPDPIALEEISLLSPAIDTPSFRNALVLARPGLWSPALKILQSQKSKNWSAAAQAQLDVIRLHAQITESQAKQAWASPSSSILANLIDGRWGDAVLVFQSSVPGPQAQEIVTLLKTDSGGLWERVTAALKVYPDDINVQAWGALILAVQQGQPKAISWLQQLSQPESDKASHIKKPVNTALIYELLERLDGVLAQMYPASRHASRIIGIAQPVLNVNPVDWLQPEDLNQTDDGSGSVNRVSPGSRTLPTQPTPPLTSPIANPTLPPTAPPQNRGRIPNLQLEPLQVWYQVQVSAFHDGQRWWKAPFSNFPLPRTVSAKQLWNYLGLDTDAKIQITVWTAEGRQEATFATVKAISLQGGVLRLLAAGDVLPTFTKTADAAVKSSLLAYTDAALQWLEPSSVTLSDLNKVQPQWVSALLPTLWRELVKSGQLPSEALPSKELLLSQMGQWSVRLLELTGNDKPDAVLTLYEDLSGGWKRLDVKRPIADNQLYKPRTVVISDAGTLLYSEFTQDASTSLTAIADLGDNGPPALVVNGKSNFSLKRWSPQNKRFE
jgi:hypothetical protein